MRLGTLRSSWLNILFLATLLTLNACSNPASQSSGGNNPPAAPTNLAATGANQQVALSWTASNGATSYNVKRGTASGGPYTTMASPSGASYADTGVTNGTTYYYVVTAVNTSGESGNSNQVSATPSTSPSAPAPPANLSATAGNQQVSLTWSASSGATSYNVKRGTTNGGPYTTVTSPTGTTYTDSGVTNGTTYYYVVTAVFANGESADSNQASATPSSTPTAPAAPANLSATAGNQQVALSWTASSGATSYNLKRGSASGGPYTTLVSPTGTTYTDSGLSNGTTYYYVVTAVSANGESADSNQASATPSATPVAPAAPTNLSATAGNQQVSLFWAASSGAASYNVKRGTASGGPYITISSSNSASYSDTSVSNGTTYYYVVTAVDAAGESGPSNQASATPSATPAAPAPPTSLAATAGNQQVSLTWAGSNGATSYNVKRGTTTGGPYATVGSSVGTSYNDTTVTNGTTYYYVVTAVDATGESSDSNEAQATPMGIPAAPENLTTSAGNQKVALSWSASTGASSYNVKRGTANGGPYTVVGTAAGTSYTDTGLINGTTYFYVVTAVDAAGQSINSNQASATPSGSITSVNVAVNVLANRHTISPYVYGGNFPQNAAAITDSGLSLVRWGGNGASTYNWQLGTNNADADYYFEDFAFGALNNAADSDSTQFIKDVKAAGSAPLMTMVMLPWVAQSAETSTTQGGTDNYHWVFSASLDGACSSNTDFYNKDAGVNLKSDCSTAMVASQAQLNRAYYPLLDDHTQSCPGGTTCVYRDDWTAALASAFGNGTCPIPYSPITSCHFYDMDNEIDIWGGTHVDVHPNPSGYDELATTYFTEATKLKTWDTQALRLGPVSCCWWYYWNGANGSDKSSHGGDDFLTWWLNQIHWQDEIAGTRSIDIFDIHAYPDGPDTSSYTQAQKQAVAASIYRDYWDPTLVSPSGTINQQWATQIQPNRTIAFRIPRLRAIANRIYPGTPLSFTEWSAALAGESDFSTALGDADAYAILGRERVSLASRWVAPTSGNPNYLALKLYTNYDGAHHGFAPISVAATNTGDPNLFSSYAAVSDDGKTLTLMVINRDPQNSAQVDFALSGFSGTSFASYTLAASAPQAITSSSSPSWSPTQTFAPYSMTLLVVSGTTATPPASEWDLNPDTILVPAKGTVTLQPLLSSGSANVNLSSAVFDSYEGAPACDGTITVTNGEITSTAPAAITVQAGTTPGFCHFTVTGSDGSATQTEGGWIVVGNPAASLATTSGNNQSGSTGSTLPQSLTVTLNAGQSGGSAIGASILFSTSAGILSNGTASGAKVIAVTNQSGVASVTLTLPSNAGQVQVQAEGPYGLGHPVATFTETAQ